MRWTDEQWDAFCALVQASWTGEFNDADRQAWRILLDDVEPQQAIVALKRLLYSGRKFYPRPAVADLMAELRQEPDRPTFAEAYPLVYKAAAAQRISPATPPLIAAFVERQGIRRLGQLPLDDPQWGEKHRRDLEAQWDEHVETWDGRQIARLASGEMSPRKLNAAETLGLTA